MCSASPFDNGYFRSSCCRDASTSVAILWTNAGTTDANTLKRIFMCRGALPNSRLNIS